MTFVFESNLTPGCLKVLLIEDCAEDAELIQELLSEHQLGQSIETTNVVGIREARKILSCEVFDVILLDVSLPDSRKFNTFLRLQEDCGINIAIVVLTAADDEELAVQLIAAGAQDYLVKRQVDSRLLVRTLRCAIARQKRQAEWQKSQEKYQQVVDRIKEVVFETNTAGNWTFLSPTWAEITGFTVDESLGTSCLSYIHPDDQHQYLNLCGSLSEKPEASWCYQIRYLTKNAEIRWVEMQEFLRFGAGGVQETTGTIKNITDKVLALSELEASKKFLNCTINAIADPIFLKDEQHRWILLNDAFCKLLGKQREELLGMSDYEFFPKEEADFFWEKDEQVFRTGEENETEEFFTDAGGEKHVLSTKKTVFQNTDGSKILVGIIRDITQDRRKQLALQESETRLQQLAANLPGIIYQFRLSPDGKMSFPYVSSGSRDLYELEPETIQQNPELIFTLIHPEDLPRIEQSIAISAATLQPWQQEWRAIVPSEKLKWVQGVSRPERVNYPIEIGQEGDIVWEGIVLDITDLKQTEGALRESETRFRSLIENIPGAICRSLYDADWTMVFVSDEIEAISGYAAADFLHNNRLSFASIIHRPDREKLDRVRRAAVDSKQPYYLEYRIVRAEAAVRWVSERGRATYNREGLVLWLDAAIFDITDRKQAELTLCLVTQAVDGASDAIAIADLDGCSIYHNQAFIQRYGYTVEELNNAGGPGVMYAKSQELRKLFKVLRKGLSWSIESELKAKNGEIIEALALIAAARSPRQVCDH